MIRMLAAGLGVVILVFALVNAGGTAVDHEVSDPANSSADDVSKETTNFIGTLVSYVPVTVAVGIIALIMVRMG